MAHVALAHMGCGYFSVLVIAARAPAASGQICRAAGSGVSRPTTASPRGTAAGSTRSRSGEPADPVDQDGARRPRRSAITLLAWERQQRSGPAPGRSRDATGAARDPRCGDLRSRQRRPGTSTPAIPWTPAQLPAHVRALPPEGHAAARAAPARRAAQGSAAGPARGRSDARSARWRRSACRRRYPHRVLHAGGSATAFCMPAAVPPTAFCVPAAVPATAFCMQRRSPPPRSACRRPPGLPPRVRAPPPGAARLAAGAVRPARRAPAAGEADRAGFLLAR